MRSKLKKLRTNAAIKQGFTCFYCGCFMWIDELPRFALRHGLTERQAGLLKCTAEHLHSQGDGGPDTPSNIVAACWYCIRDATAPRHR